MLGFVVPDNLSRVSENLYSVFVSIIYHVKCTNLNFVQTKGTHLKNNNKKTLAGFDAQ